MDTNSIDVLIVGAGPVGLFCAHEMARQGLSCRIIDKKSTLSQHSKALGIHIRTLDVLEDCNLLDDVLTQGHRVEKAIFKSNGKEVIHADFSGIEASHHFLIDLPQDKTEAIFSQACNEKGIVIEWDTELAHISQSPSGVSATIKKPNNKIEIVESSWLIACDGAHSTIRHELDEPFEGSEYEQTWWLADLLVDWDIPENQMMLYISQHGPMACFPMGNKRYRIVMTAPQNQAEDPNLDQIRQAFSLRATDKAKLHNPYWLAQFKIHHRQIKHYRHGRIFLAGDAAHIHSPMGGQGLNTGLQDIYNLGWKLALVQKNLAQEKILDTYQLERYPVGKEVLKKTHLMTRLILMTSPLLIRLRNHFLRFITQFQCVRNKMAKNIAELTITYKKSPLVENHGRLHGLNVGEYFKDFLLSNINTGKQESSHSICHDTYHHLFLFCGQKRYNLEHLKDIAVFINQKFQETIIVHLVVPGISESVQIPYNIWLDVDYAVHKRFHIKKPSAILVRPDNYIGFVQTSVKQKTLGHYLNEWFISSASMDETQVTTEQAKAGYQ